MPKSSKTKAIRRREVWSKAIGICAHCGRAASSRKQTIDHFVPVVAGGGNDRRNLMPLCKACNSHRADKEIDPEEFYTYAPLEAIRDCIEYRDEWIKRRTNSQGEFLDPKT